MTRGPWIDRSLRTWLFAPVAGGLGLVAGVLVIGLPLRFQGEAERWAEERAITIAMLTAEAVVGGLEFEDPEFVGERLRRLESLSDARYAVVCRRDGLPLAAWGERPTSLPVFVDATGGPQITRVRDRLVARVNLLARGGTTGSLIVVFDEDQVRAAWQREQLFAAGISLTVFVVGVVGAWAYGTSLTEPLRALTAATRHGDARSVAESAAKLVPPQRYSRDERMVLITAFAQMAQRLAEQFADIEVQRQRAVEAEETARRASEVKSRFLANMSHELRTPLNAIIGYAEMLAESPGLEDQERQDIARIVGSASHLVALINDILDLAKVEADRLSILVQPFDVRRAADEVAAAILPMARAGENHLYVSVADDVGLMWSDELRVRQCLMNLLSNAAKFTANGTVALTVTRAGDAVSFAVHDTGPGMSDEQQAQLFQSFSQLDPSTTRRHGGTGLGLVLTRRFARLLGGDVAVRSAVGVGSTFTLTLPVQLPPPSPDRHPRLGPDVGASFAVLPYGPS